VSRVKVLSVGSTAARRYRGARVVSTKRSMWLWISNGK